MRFDTAEIFDGAPITTEKLSWLRSKLTKTKSTAGELCSHLDMPEPFCSGPTVQPVLALLHIINHDISGFARFASKILQEVGQAAPDEYGLLRQLNHWRYLLSRLQTELPEIHHSMKSFADFLRHRNLLGEDEDMSFFDSTLMQLEDLIVRTQQSYDILRADMAVLENKRGIAQAEGVGKLTELGFLFLPISCVAALFSMQVKELQGGVELSSFLIAAAITVVLAYFARLFVRSALLLEMKRHISQRIRAHSKTASGLHIPTRAVLSWIMSWDFIDMVATRVKAGVTQLLPFLIFLSVLLPILFVWTHRHLGAGFKSAVTILVLFSVIAVALVPQAFWGWWVQRSRLRQTLSELRASGRRRLERRATGDARGDGTV